MQVLSRPKRPHLSSLSSQSPPRPPLCCRLVLFQKRADCLRPETAGSSAGCREGPAATGPLWDPACPRTSCESKERGSVDAIFGFTQHILNPPPSPQRLLPGADGQYLQQAGGGHLEGGAELRHSGFLQQLQRLSQHRLRPAQLGQHTEQPAGDGQGHVHRLVADAQREDGDQQEALLSFWDGGESIRRGVVWFVNDLMSTAAQN